MELGEHQEFILKFSELQCAHFIEHFFNSFKTEVLKHLGNFFQMLLDPLLLSLVDYCCHYVREYAELIEKSHLDP